MLGPDQAGSDTTGASTVVERPPPGPAQGLVSVPAWAVAALGTTIVLLALSQLSWRLFPRMRLWGSRASR
jgi:hypothetical protein